MKRVFILISVLFYLQLLAQVTTAPADTSLLILDQTTAKASSGQGALNELISLEDRGIQDPDLFYNIGVSYYREGDNARAMLYFLRALNLNSAHSKAAHNVAFIRDMSPDRDMMVQRQFLESLFLEIYDWFNLNRSSLAALFWLFITALCLHWLLHYDPGKERGLPTLMLILSSLFLLCFGGLSITKAYRMKHNSKAVVAQDNSPIFSAPTQSAEQERPVNAALIVIAGKSENGFVSVILPDGSSAWMKSGDILKVAP